MTRIAHKNLIGIDCGKKTGVAVWDVNAQKFSVIKTVDFWSAYEWVASSFSANETMVYVEDPSQNKPVWRRATMKDYEWKKIKKQVRVLIAVFSNCSVGPKWSV